MPSLQSLRSLVAALVSLCAALCPVSLALAQDDPATSGGRFFERVDVNIVNVEVVVTDKKGNPVTGLTAGDFRLFVDGRETEISNFYAEAAGAPAVETPSGIEVTEAAPVTARVTPPPEQRLHVMVLVDSGNLRPVNSRRVDTELRRFLTEGLPPEARIAVASLGRQGVLKVHSDYLDDRTSIPRILDEVRKVGSPDFRTAQRRRIIADIQDGLLPGEFTELLARIRAHAGDAYSHGRTVLQTMDRFIATLAGVPGRRMLLYVSDGLPRRPGESLFFTLMFASGNQTVSPSDFIRQIGDFDLLRGFDEVAARANAGGVVLYSLDAAGSAGREIRGAVSQGRVDSYVLSTFEANFRDPQEHIAQATGGRRLEATTRLDDELAEIATELTTFYALGFRQDRSDRPERRKVRVEVVDRKDLRVRNREAIFAKSLEHTHAEAVLATLLYGTGSNSLGISVSTGSPEPRDDGAAVVPLEVHVPLSRVALLPRGETYEGELTVYVSTQDEAGNARPVQKLPFHIKVPASRFDEAQGQDAKYTLPLVVRPGDSRAVIGVTDTMGTAVSTVRTDLDPASH